MKERRIMKTFKSIGLGIGMVVGYVIITIGAVMTILILSNFLDGRL